MRIDAHAQWTVLLHRVAQPQTEIGPQRKLLLWSEPGTHRFTALLCLLALQCEQFTGMFLNAHDLIVIGLDCFDSQ